MKQEKYLFFMQVVCVKFQGVKLYRKGAWVVDFHLLLISNTVGQDGVKLQKCTLKVKSGFKALAVTHKKDPLTALRNTYLDSILIDFL